MLDADGLGRLYDRYAPLAHARARRLLGDDAQAWDVVHDVFVRLARRGGAGRDPLRYVYRATTNACIDHRRRAAHRGAVPLDDALWLAAESRVEDATGARHALEALWSGLDETDRQIVVLHFVDGLPQDEVAEALGVWRRTVGRRLSRLRDRARALVQENHP